MCLCVEFTLHCTSLSSPAVRAQSVQSLICVNTKLIYISRPLKCASTHSNHVQVWRLLSKVTLKCKFYKCINKDQYTVCILFVFTCGRLNKNDQECLKMVISYCMYRRAGIFFNTWLSMKCSFVSQCLFIWFSSSTVKLDGCSTASCQYWHNTLCYWTNMQPLILAFVSLLNECQMIWH